ncbi:MULTISPECIES: ABC transporter permease [Streptomyces]|nr:ABC transporter permease [Streptomyces ruber]
MAALARAELTLLGRTKATLFAALFVPLVMPVGLSTSIDGMDLSGTGLSTGAVIISSTLGFSLLFAVYSSLVSVYAARREELVLKRLRTGELRDAEILAGAALPSVAIALVQSVVLIAACIALLDVGAPEAPHYAVLGLLLGLVMWPALAAVTSSFSRSVEGAQFMSMPLIFLSMMGSGTFVPLEVMPDGLARICELLPLTPVVTLVRGGWTGGLPASDVLTAVVTGVAWTALAMWAVRRWFRWEPRR